MAVKRKIKAPIKAAPAKSKPAEPMAKSKVEEEVSATQLAAVQRKVRALGKLMLDTPGKAPFNIPATPAKIEERLGDVIKDNDAGVAETALLLYEMQHKYPKFLATSGAATVEEWASARFMVGEKRVKSLLAQASLFYSVGLERGHLGGKYPIAFSKFRLITSAITDGLITKKNIHDVLPFIAREGEFARSVDRVSKDVRQLYKNALDKKALSEKKQEKEKKVAITVPEGCALSMQKLLDAYAETRGLKGFGEAVYDAVQTAAAFHSSGNIGRIGGMVNLRNTMATLYPVVPIMFTDDPGLSSEDVGLPVVSKVFVVVGVEDDRDFQAVVALDAADAAAHFGVPVTRVREWKLSVTKQIRPAVTYNDLVAEDRATSQTIATAVTPEPPAKAEVTPKTDTTDTTGVPDAPPVPEAVKPKRTRRTKAQIAADNAAEEAAAKAVVDQIIAPPAEIPVAETPAEPVTPAPIADADAPTTSMQPDETDEPVAPTPGEADAEIVAWSFSADDIGKFVTYDVNGTVTRARIDRVLDDEEIVVLRHVDDKGKSVGGLHSVLWTSIIDFIDDEGDLNNWEKNRAEIGQIGKLCKKLDLPQIPKTIEAEYLRLRKQYGVAPGEIPPEKAVPVFRDLIIFSRKLLIDNKVTIEE